MNLARTYHPGGIQVGLADGGVRTIANSISPITWAQACEPNDGKPMPSDW